MSPINPGGSTNFDPKLKGAGKLGGKDEQPSAQQMAQQIQSYLNQSPPDYNDMFNYVLANYQVASTALPNDVLSGCLQNIAQNEADPTTAYSAAKQLVVSLNNAH